MPKEKWDINPIVEWYVRCQLCFYASGAGHDAWDQQCQGTVMSALRNNYPLMGSHLLPVWVHKEHVIID